MIRALLLILISTATLQAQEVDSMVVDISEQKLYAYQQGEVLKVYSVSTSKYGIGSEAGSNKTPLGLHSVRSKYGNGLAAGSVLVGRIPTGEIAVIESQPRSTGLDHVTTRILWLQGLEPGKNQGSGIDSHDRYIYIHGTHEEGLIGQPASHGCVRMMNKDVIWLFEHTSIGVKVFIQE